MNYYEHHLGDYARDAGKLSMLRDGAYFRLMGVYYGRELPLPLELAECFDLAGCASKVEQDAVEYILKRFFYRGEDGYHQKRCDEEIARFKAKSEAAKVGANARWAHNGRNANGMRTHSDGNALQSPVSNPQSPIQNTSPNPSFGKGGASRQRRSERRAEQDEAAIIWDRLIATDGKDRDHRSQAALDAIGGWRAWQMRTASESASLRKRFVEAYRTLSAVKPNGAKPTERRPDREDEIEREEAARADG